MTKFVSVEHARGAILDRIPLTGVERVHLLQARGRYLAEAIKAPWSSPRFDNSAMDGVALRWDDLSNIPETLSVHGESAAGHPSPEVLQEGQAFRISTGAPVPPGADTVVPRELCEFDDDQVTIVERPSAGKGANIRYQGTYLEAQEPALLPGTRIDGAAMGLLASFNEVMVTVGARPRVAVVSTGDELVDLGKNPGPGQIVNSNAYLLASLIDECGATPRIYPTAKDDRQAIESAYRRAINECDFVVSSGGVSVGDHDHVRAVLAELAGGMTFWKVRMKPGKPLAFGVASDSGTDVPLIGLPGNPGACFVAFHLFLRPALAVAQGARPATSGPQRVQATLAGSDLRGSRSRRVYAGGRLIPGARGELSRFEPAPHQSSGNPTLFAGCNALGIVDDDAPGIEVGDPVDVLLL